jgi:hypothetical protein
MGHASKKTIKKLVKNNIGNGIPSTYDDIKDLHLKLYPSCMKGRMKAFPMPPSINNKVYDIFELLTVDIIPIMKPSIRGFKYVAFFVDKTTLMMFPKLMKRKNNFLNCLQAFINENRPQRNFKSTSLKFLLGDYDTVITDQDTKNFLDLNHITLYSSAPYKHEQK